MILKKRFINIFKNGIDTFLKETLKSDYQIFSHALYRSIRKNLTDSPEGSQLGIGTEVPQVV